MELDSHYWQDAQGAGLFVICAYPYRSAASKGYFFTVEGTTKNYLRMVRTIKEAPASLTQLIMIMTKY
ncbi:hypothetical protein ABF86_00985 [Nitrosomonas sp. GH22]|nr:hypothetical protein [Nitrosomonas sp. GH22]